MQDAAYGTLLREPRRALHARIAETLESQFPEIAENQPELLARHCTEAGLIEKAARLWGKAGQRSLARSALVEAARATHAGPRPDCDLARHARAAPRADQASSRARNALMHIKGLCRAGNQSALRSRHALLIEQAEALGEPPEDPLLLFSVLYGFWVANYVAFNGDVCRELAAQFLALAEKQRATGPAYDRASPYGHFLVIDGRHCRRPSASTIRRSRFTILPSIVRWRRDLAKTSGWQSCPIGRWPCGCLAIPRPRSQTSNAALKDAREIGQAATLMFALYFASFDPYLLRKLRDSKCAQPMNLSLWRTKKAPCSGRRAE